MNVEPFIKAPGSVFSAREKLKELGLAPANSHYNLSVGKQHVASSDADKRAIGIEILWCLASFGNDDAIRAFVDVVERFIENSDLNASERRLYSEIASHWKKQTSSPFDFGLEEPEAPQPSDFGSLPLLNKPSRGFIVLSEVGDAGSTDGKLIRSRYESIIGKPLRHAGLPLDSPSISQAVLQLCPWAKRAAETLERASLTINHTFSNKGFSKPLLFVGPPGTGKTSLALGIGRMLGRHTVKISVSGTNDSGSLAPVTRGWSSSRASFPVQAMLESMTCDPCVIVDEIDKASRVGSQNGSVMGALLGMLDNSQSYYDTALMAQVDMSHILFMATANDVSLLEPALLDRFTVIPVDRPGVEHFDLIVSRMKANKASELEVDPFCIPDLDEEERSAMLSFFKSSKASLRALSEAYDVALAAATLREREMSFQ